jgi:uncharacterized protein
MKAGVVSDTHGNIENLARAVERLVSSGADILIHLGDDAADIKRLKDLKMKVVSVPGVFESSYADKKIPNRLLEEFDGVRVLITHTPSSHEKDIPGDIKPEDVIASGGAELVLHGHTHRAGVETEGGVTLLNPGHLKPSDARGGEPSFALVDFTAREVKIVSLKDKTVVMRRGF